MEGTKAQELYEMMKQHLAFYKEFLGLEKAKMEDISKNNVASLDNYVKKEEAYLLKARGFETKRNKFLNEIGLENTTMKEVIKTAPDEKKELLEDAYNELSNILLDLKEVNKRCNFMIQIRLQRIEASLNALKSNEKQNIYTQSAKGTSMNSELISSKV